MTPLALHYAPFYGWSKQHVLNGFLDLLMARLLDRVSLQDVDTSTGTTNNDGLPLIPSVHFSTAMAPDGGTIVSQSQAVSSLQTEAQASTFDESQTRSSDLAQMLASLQSTGDLSALLQQQPNLLQGMFL